MMRSGTVLAVLIGSLLLFGTPVAVAQEDAAVQADTAAPPPKAPPKAITMDDLLKRVRQGWNTERQENRDREKRFKKQRDEQVRLLKEAKATRAKEEKRSEALEIQFQENEVTLAQLEDTRRERLGALGELFGVVRQVAGDTNSIVSSSIVSAQFPGREEFLEELGKSKSLPSIASLEKLWFTLLQEMAELGNVTRFRGTVIDVDGNQTERDVIRVGGFNAVSDGKYLVLENGHLQELPRQPAGTYLDTVAPFESSVGTMARLAIDPSRGSILKVLIETPDAGERIEQGGLVGYAIITLGILAGALAIVRWLIVTLAAGRVATQKRSDEVNRGNPLGRVLGIYEDNKDADVETLELKLDEVIMREASKLERLLWAVKVVSVVAPLMGLLGTVTGMIQTFQAITLFGTGDPKMMASGISEALVTTMLGLIVAIPLVLLHAMVANSSKGVIQILEEQAAGLIARRAEQVDAA